MGARLGATRTRVGLEQVILFLLRVLVRTNQSDASVYRQLAIVGEQYGQQLAPVLHTAGTNLSIAIRQAEDSIAGRESLLDRLVRAARPAHRPAILCAGGGLPGLALLAQPAQSLGQRRRVGRRLVGWGRRSGLAALRRWRLAL